MLCRINIINLSKARLLCIEHGRRAGKAEKPCDKSNLNDFYIFSFSINKTPTVPGPQWLEITVPASTT
jgi:hypothetical protein